MCRSFLFPTSIIGTLQISGTVSLTHKHQHHSTVSLGNSLDWRCREVNTHCTFPTMSNSFSWITCTTSKLQKHKVILKNKSGFFCFKAKPVNEFILTIHVVRGSSKEIPFIGCNWIDQNVAVDIYGVCLWEDGVLILEDIWIQCCLWELHDVISADYSLQTKKKHFIIPVLPCLPAEDGTPVHLLWSF